MNALCGIGDRFLIMAFKVHMIRWADTEGFQTMCGIDDGASDAFYQDENNLVEYGSPQTTCKKCIHVFQKEIKEYDAQMKKLRNQIDPLIEIH